MICCHICRLLVTVGIMDTTDSRATQHNQGIPHNQATLQPKRAIPQHNLVTTVLLQLILIRAVLHPTLEVLHHTLVEPLLQVEFHHPLPMDNQDQVMFTYVSLVN